jgi:hypothetical protein
VLIPIGLALTAFFFLAAVHFSVRRRFAALEKASPQGMAFLGDVASCYCAIGDAANAYPEVAPFMDAIRKVSTTGGKTPLVDDFADAYQTVGRLVLPSQRPSSPPDLPVARRRAQELTDADLTVLRGMTPVDSATASITSNVQHVVLDLRRMAVEEVVDPHDVEQLDRDLAETGNSLEVKWVPIEDSGPAANGLAAVYAVIWARQLPIVSGLARELLANVVVNDQLDHALRRSPAFEAARTRGCLSGGARLIDAIDAFIKRELGEHWMERLNEPRPPTAARASASGQ